MKKYLFSLLIAPFFFIGCGSGDNNATFEAPNNPPIIYDLSLNTTNNQSVNVSLATHDSDGEAITYEIVSSPLNGSASFDENILIYTPNLNYAGIEYFTYRAFDGTDYSQTKQVMIIATINVNNNQPTIQDITDSTNKNIDYVIALDNTDIDGDILNYRVVSGPTNGNASFSGNVLTYTPNTDYFGSDSFTYVANDGLIDSVASTVSITVNNVNNAPLIYSSMIPEGTEGTSYSYTIPVEDPDGDTITLSLETVDSFGNSIAAPAWLIIDSANAKITSSDIDLNAEPIIYLKITATDSFGAVSTAIKEWNIVDYSPFELIWNTQNAGESDNNTISFYVELNPNNIIDWGDGIVENNVANGVKSHTYAIAGTYTVSIIGAKAFETYGTNGSARDNTKIIGLNSWGSSMWIDMEDMFRGATNLVSYATDTPDTRNVTDMSYMFNGCLSYNQPMNDWKVGNVKDMSYMFSSAASFNQPLDLWDVRSVVNMTSLFYDTTFNQDISGWNVSNVTSFSNMFNSTPFNQPVGTWDVSSATTLSSMFRSSPFNQDISSWNVSNVTSLYYTFASSSFNQDISSWDVSNVTNFDSTFRSSPFNLPLNTWNISNGLNFNYTFYANSAFDQDLSSWTPINATTMVGFVSNTPTFSTANYDLLLNAWAGLALQSGVSFGANNTNYTIATSDAARTFLITNFTWTITDAGGI